MLTVWVDFWCKTWVFISKQNENHSFNKLTVSETTGQQSKLLNLYMECKNIVETRSHNVKLYGLKWSNLKKGQWNMVNSTPLTHNVFSSLITSNPLLSHHLSTHLQQTTVRKTTPRKQGSSLGVQLGHFLKVYPNALTVEQDKINVFQRGAGGRHKVVGDGLEDELGCRLFWKSVPVRDSPVSNSTF